MRVVITLFLLTVGGTLAYTWVIRPMLPWLRSTAWFQAWQADKRLRQKERELRLREKALALSKQDERLAEAEQAALDEQLTRLDTALEKKDGKV